MRFLRRETRGMVSIDNGQPITFAPATPDGFDVLARYNAEVARGIVHTAEWDARMAGMQRLWDAREQHRENRSA